MLTNIPAFAMPIFEIQIMPKDNIMGVAQTVEGAVQGFATRSSLTEVSDCLSAVDSDAAEF